MTKSPSITDYAALLRALAQGWAVEPPVYAMKDPSRPSRGLLQFILWRDGRPRVASLDDSQDVRQWIDAQCWTVVRLG